MRERTMRTTIATVVLAVMMAGAAPFSTSAAEKKYGPGVTDTEIKIGQTMPYSGPASAYGTVGRLESAYFEMINSQGGVNGRKIKLISLDDSYSPPKTVEQTRRLVEQDEVLAVVGQLGTLTASAAQKYLNIKKVPQILITSGAAKWDNPKAFPYSTYLYAPYHLEGQVFAKYLLKNKPDAKLGVFSQNDDAGRDYVRGLKDGLGDKAAAMIVKEMTYETTESLIDSQIVTLKASGADTLFIMTTPKFGAQAVRKIAELGWKPLTYLSAVSSSIKTVLEPAGLDNSKGLITALAVKRPEDPRWENAKDVQDYKAFLEKWYPSGNLTDSSNISGYMAAYVAVKILERCGDELTRDNVLKQATNLTELSAPLLLPGITITTTPTRYTPFSQMQIARFDGTTWVPEGELISATDK
ncbi:branched-chain amino acid ABC transporter substrate-binding protein [Rhodopseudomonas palustris]|uniref:Branched-chain amino acid ABC transporter substrate-binding protein n=2 Tax=Nitrobacteraceae TaxID=41294 RepID=A0A0D7F0W5_RHOPL|nr:branched-chain amino acid ABC transporter substrate-binding protein [Rhodopseudomonas palustris]